MILKMSESDENDGFVTSCTSCERRFSHYKALYCHMRKFHKDQPIQYKRKRYIICTVCDEEQPTTKLYWDHIQAKHPEVQLSFEKKFFYSDEDFVKWRKEIETRTHTHYTTARTQRELSDGRIVYQLRCDRSGIYTPSANRTRKCTSKKIGKCCPAYIYCSKTVVDDLMEIEVDFQSTHVGHKFDLHSLRFRSEAHERRLRSRGKGRWPKKVENPLPHENEEKEQHNDDLNEKQHDVDLDGDTFAMEVSDLLQRDPNLQIQHVACTCEEYAKVAVCEHVQTLLRSLNRIRLTEDSSGRDESNRVVESSCVDLDITSAIADDLSNPIDNSNLKTLDDEKVSILQEFQEVVDMCQNGEHLQILKELVTESKKQLLSKLKCDQQRNSHSSMNMKNAVHTIKHPVVHRVSAASLDTSALSLPSIKKIVVLREGMVSKIKTENERF